MTNVVKFIDLFTLKKYEFIYLQLESTAMIHNCGNILNDVQSN